MKLLKAIFIIGALIFNFLLCRSQITHIIDRGETLRDIAIKYNVTEEEILALNPEVADIMLAGIELTLPQHAVLTPPSYMFSTNKNGKILKNYAKEAEKAFNSGKYKKAAGLYSKALKQDYSLNLVFNRGLSYYNAGKYKEAIGDFCVIDMEASSESMKKQAKQLMADAEELQRQKEERDAQRAEAAFNFAMGLLGTAVNITNYATGNYSYTPDLTIPSTMLYSSMMPVFTTAPVMTQPSVYIPPFNPTFDTTPVWNNNFYGDYNNFNSWDFNGGYDSGFSSGYDSYEGSNNSTDWEQKKKDILNTTYGEYCKSCNGSGKCHACNGTKVAHGLGQTYACTICNQNGDCSACSGTGKTSWNR